MTDDQTFALLLDRWATMVRSGRRISAEELCRDCPELLDELRRRLREVGSTWDPQHTASVATESNQSGEEVSPQGMAGFEILEELGRGGMGVVYKARQLKLNRIVAVKMVLGGGSASSRDRIRFLMEAESIASLQHPNIVQIYESGIHDGLPYFALEFVEGGSLGRQVREQPLTPRAAAILVEQVARGVAAAHARGIVHRDLKPDNILLTRDGVPKITDFGLAKQVVVQGTEVSPRSDLTDTGAVMGTPSYMAPEQASGRGHEIGPLTDVWAVGAILYRLLTRRPPFHAATAMETMMHVLREDPVPPSRLVPKLPRDLETITLKCLQKEPGRRIASATDVADDLQRFLNQEPIRARPIGRWERGSKWVRRNPMVSAAAVIVVMSLLLGTTVSYVKYRDAERARLAEGLRVSERDDALAQAEQREEDLKYLLGISDFLLANAAFANRDARLASERLAKIPLKQRRFAWNYFSRRVRGGIFALEGHTDSVWEVAFSPDGARLATASADRTARVWNARTGELRLVLRGHRHEVTGVAFSPDRRLLATSSRDQTVRLWNARSGEFIKALTGHAAELTCLAFSPDSRRIATAGRDATARIWDIERNAIQATFTGHTGELTYLAFSPDGSQLATASADSTARIWHVQSGSLLHELKGHDHWVSSVAFSPDGLQVATSCGDRVVRLWDARTGTRQLELTGHAGWVSRVAFTPDGTRVITASDATVRVWDRSSGKRLTEHVGHTHWVTSVAVSPDGMRLATASHDRTAQLWDIETGEPITALTRHAHWVQGVAFSPDGKLLATAGLDEAARVWDAYDGTLRREFTGHAPEVRQVAFSPDGRRLATADSDHIARVWDVRDGTLLLQLTGHGDAVMTVAFSPSGHHIATGSRDRGVRIWEAASGRLIHHLTGHLGTVNRVTFDQEGTRLASVGDDGMARVWNVTRGDLLAELPGPEQGTNDVAFSPDIRYLATASNDSIARIWEWQTRTVRLELKGHSSDVTGVSFSPDGTRIATASRDRTVRIWDARSDMPLLELSGHSGEITGVAFSPDGQRIATSSGDTTARIWHGDACDSLAARLNATRSMTDRHVRDLEMARKTGNTFAAAFHLEQLLASQADDHGGVLPIRPTISPNHLVQARDLRLARRLQGIAWLHDGKPAPALPLLHISLIHRGPHEPPVEEFLIAKCLYALNRPADADRYYRAAMARLEQGQRPFQGAHAVTMAFATPWNILATLAPTIDPRFTRLDWESWKECEQARREVEDSRRAQ